MKSVYAFIVGIEKYDQQPDWSVIGPCANAVAIAEWCLSAGVPPENVFLFLDAKEENGASVAALRARGVILKTSAKFEVIDRFFRTRLAKERPANSLLVYWSGHGFVENNGTRIFIYSDYTAAELNNRVFNASRFLRFLRSEYFRCFREQIFLADVCGVYPNSLEFQPDRSDPGKLLSSAKQTVYFATPEGKYAEGGYGRGVFTDIAVGVLRQCKDWPEQFEFMQKMEYAFRRVGRTPFRMLVISDSEEYADRLVGTIPTENKSPHFKSLVSLLSPIKLADSVYRRHYLRTVSDLGDPKLAEAQGISGMINELLSLRDRAHPDDVPYGLIQFLTRLCQENGLDKTIEPWLDEHAARQGNARANVREKLEDEGAEKLLIVEVVLDDRGRIGGFQPFLRTAALRPVPNVTFAHQDVRDWDDFEAKLISVVRELQSRPEIKYFQIHVLVDTPLFERPFHNVPIDQGLTLGEEFVVVVRHRERARSRDPNIRAAWLGYAEALSRSRPEEVKFVRIPAPGPARTALPSEKGFCYAGFILPPTAGLGAGGSNEQQLFRRLMRLGVPYLYWLHSAPPAGVEEVEPTLAKWLGELKSLDGFPVSFMHERNRGTDYARQASLLWDDPQFNPFSLPGGA